MGFHMNHFIVQLLRYWQCDLDEPTRWRLRKEIGDDKLQLGGLPVLNWLRRHGQGTVTGPLVIEGALGPHVRALVAEVPEMAKLFVVTGDSLDFRATVPVEEQREIEAYVVAHPLSADYFFESYTNGLKNGLEGT